jgi:hypothetical protein
VTSASRFPALPDLPAVSEFAPGVVVNGWFAVVAPQEIALSMLDEIAVVDDVLRHVNVLPRRPARHISGMALAAFENVKPLDTLALRKGRGASAIVVNAAAVAIFMGSFPHK